VRSCAGRSGTLTLVSPQNRATGRLECGAMSADVDRCVENSKSFHV
jgi:hypothetical protein